MWPFFTFHVDKQSIHGASGKSAKNLSQADPSHAWAGLVGVKRENGELVLQGEEKPRFRLTGNGILTHMDGEFFMAHIGRCTIPCFCTWMSKVFLLPRIRWMGGLVVQRQPCHTKLSKMVREIPFGPANVRSSTYVDNMRRASEK